MSSTTLKIIALILMIIDHIHYFIPNMPSYFRWFGRSSAPIFFFCMVWGFHYTKKKSIYLARMYLFNLGMAIVDLVLSYIYRDTYTWITNNIFTTLLLIAVIIYLYEKNNKKYWIFFTVWQLFTTVFSILMTEFIRIPRGFPTLGTAYMFYGSLFGNLLFTEGGMFFVLLGVCIYLARNKKPILIIGYALFCVFVYLTNRKFDTWRGITDFLFPYGNDQWLMIFALPLMLMYNGKKGMGLKYFFYIFYPLHLIILYLISVHLL